MKTFLKKFIEVCYFALWRPLITFLKFVLRFFKKYYRFFLILFVTFLLPLPNIFLNNDYKPVINGSNLQPNEKTQVSINIPNHTYLSSESFLTKIFSIVGQDIEPPTISICLYNDTRPYPPGWNPEIYDVKSRTELGALSITVRDVNLLKAEEIYTKTGSSTCKQFSGRQIEVINAEDMVINQIQMPAKTLGGEDVLLGYSDLGNSKLTVRVDFNFKKYLIEAFIVLLCIGVLIQIIKTLWDFCFKNMGSIYHSREWHMGDDTKK